MGGVCSMCRRDEKWETGIGVIYYENGRYKIRMNCVGWIYLAQGRDK